MINSFHVSTFAGLPVLDYEPGQPLSLGVSGAYVYRLSSLGEDDEGDTPNSLPELLDRYLQEPQADQTTALVIGAWNYDDMLKWGSGNREIIGDLVAARKRLPRLRALFLGDITFEECEISWLNQGDVGPLLNAYPQLEEFRVRGVINLTFGKLRHEGLRTLAIESGGLPAVILAELWEAELPNLEHLELWLGTDNYGGIDTVEPLAPLLSGRLFPKLRYLGLRNSSIADEVAQTVAQAPVLERMKVLDLSMGNLSDEGADALLDSPSVCRLEQLDLFHHYLSDEVSARLEQLPLKVNVGGGKPPEEDPSERYNAVSE